MSSLMKASAVYQQQAGWFHVMHLRLCVVKKTEALSKQRIRQNKKKTPTPRSSLSV